MCSCVYVFMCSCVHVLMVEFSEYFKRVMAVGPWPFGRMNCFKLVRLVKFSILNSHILNSQFTHSQFTHSQFTHSQFTHSQFSIELSEPPHNLTTHALNRGGKKTCPSRVQCNSNIYPYLPSEENNLFSSLEGQM